MIVLDTSFYVAYKNTRDEHHAAAAAAWEEVVASAPILLHEYALAEITAVLVRRLGTATAAAHATELLEAAEVEVVPAWPGFPAAWRRFAQQRGTRHGLADAALLQMAEERGVRRIATFDQEFRKAKGVSLVPNPGQ
jgi:predicted nucleic acid-binding protein